MAVSSGARRRFQKGERRRQLVELGLEMLSSEPRELVAIDRIAEVAGISRGLLFHYFPTKRDFHLAVVRAACERLLERTAPEPRLEPGARLRASLVAYVDFVADNQSLYRALIRGAAGADPELQGEFDGTREAILRRVYDYLGVSAPRPEIRAAVRGWIGFVEESTLEGLAAAELDRQALVELQVAALQAVLLAAGATVPAGGPAGHPRRMSSR